jgi:hypothetical protein
MDSTVATDFSLITGGAAQPVSHLQAVVGGVFPHNNNLHLQSMSLIPPHKFLPFLWILWEHTLQLSFLYQTPTKLFRWNLQTKIISNIGECRWSPISLVKVFFTSLTAQCHVLHLMFLTVLRVLVDLLNFFGISFFVIFNWFFLFHLSTLGLSRIRLHSFFYLLSLRLSLPHNLWCGFDML